jgi:AraC-like DNA-binding protein
MEFIRLKIKEEFKIDSLISLHYFEFARDYVFYGERHNFWELLYVDQGEVEVMAGRNGYRLKQGDLIFHKPNEFHNVWANKKISSNIIVLSFVCNSKAMANFKNKVLAVGDQQKNMIGNIIKEGFKSFVPPFNNPIKHELIRNKDSDFGSEQMVKIYLQLLLIDLTRKNKGSELQDRLSSSAKERTESDIIKRLDKYLYDNIDENLNLDEVCNQMKISRTHLVTLFKLKKGTGVIEYFKNLKIERAKIIMREENSNLTEISEILGYKSIHSFSRHFKKVTGMSPSEYTKSIKSILNLYN